MSAIDRIEGEARRRGWAFEKTGEGRWKIARIAVRLGAGGDWIVSGSRVSNEDEVLPAVERELNRHERAERAKRPQAPCTCGNSLAAHDQRTGRCIAADCQCVKFTYDAAADRG